MYTSCEPPFGVPCNRTLDIVKICWLAPVVFLFRFGRVLHVKSYVVSFICRLSCNTAVLELRAAS